MDKTKLTSGAYYLAPYASTQEHVRDLAQCGIDVVVSMRNDRVVDICGSVLLMRG